MGLDVVINDGGRDCGDGDLATLEDCKGRLLSGEHHKCWTVGSWSVKVGCRDVAYDARSLERGIIAGQAPRMIQ